MNKLLRECSKRPEGRENKAARQLSPCGDQFWSRTQASCSCFLPSSVWLRHGHTPTSIFYRNQCRMEGEVKSPLCWWHGCKNCKASNIMIWSPLDISLASTRFHNHCMHVVTSQGHGLQRHPKMKTYRGRVIQVLIRVWDQKCSSKYDSTFVWNLWQKSNITYSLHAIPVGIVFIVILTVQIAQTRWSPIMDLCFFPNTLEKRVPMYLLQQAFCLTLAIDLLERVQCWSKETHVSNFQSKYFCILSLLGMAYRKTDTWVIWCV